MHNPTQMPPLKPERHTVFVIIISWNPCTLEWREGNMHRLMNQCIASKRTNRSHYMTATLLRLNSQLSAIWKWISKVTVPNLTYNLKGSGLPFRRVCHSDSRHSWSLQGIVLDIATTRWLTLTLTLTISLTVSCHCWKWLKMAAPRNGGPSEWRANINLKFNNSNIVSHPYYKFCHRKLIHITITRYSYLIG